MSQESASELVESNGHISILDVRKLFETAAAKPPRIEPVTIPGFGTVHVKGLKASEFDDWELACVDETGTKNKAQRALLVRHCVVTPDGQKVFRDDQIEMLQGMSAGIIGPIAKKAMELCGLGKVEQDAIEGN